jgi:hypothetical protein
MKINSRNMRDKILALVKKDARFANDDKLLIAAIWWGEGWKDKELYKYLQEVSSPETIRRTRQKLVEEGLIKPSNKVQEARNNAEQQARGDLGY